jgi:hypothetical protein
LAKWVTSFTKVKPGDYHLRTRSAPRACDMQMTVGEKTVLDLTPENTVAPKDAIKRKSAPPA